MTLRFSGVLLRTWLFVGVIGVFLVMFGVSVMKKETLLSSGQQMIISLRPVDPRSLMQGDYMILQFTLSDEIQAAVNKHYPSDDHFYRRTFKNHLRGVAYVRLDENNVVSFVGLEEDVKNTDGLQKIKYAYKNYKYEVSSSSFLFQEGKADDFNRARYAELRVAEDGTALITHLLDDKFQRIH